MTRDPALPNGLCEPTLITSFWACKEGTKAGIKRALRQREGGHVVIDLQPEGGERQLRPIGEADLARCRHAAYRWGGQWEE